MNVISYDGYINHYEHGLMTIGRSGYPQVFDHGTRVYLLNFSYTIDRTDGIELENMI